jgi:hypothetical protein
MYHILKLFFYYSDQIQFIVPTHSWEYRYRNLYKINGDRLRHRFVPFFILWYMCTRHVHVHTRLGIPVSFVCMY